MCSVLPVLIVLAILSALPAAAAVQEAAASAQNVSIRAVELEAQGNHIAALPLLWKAAELAPTDADVQNRLGEALERIGALDAAVEAYRRAVSDRPAFRKASNNLILALVKAGKGSEAFERARALVAAAPDDPDRVFTLGLAQSEQDVSEAIKTFRRVLELAPRHALARYNLALVLKRADRLPEALDELGRALAIEPRPEIHYTLGVISWHLGNLDRAGGALRAAVAADPRYADAYYALGAVLTARRDWTGAATALRRAIALRPDWPAAHYTLGQMLKQSGDESGARSHLAEAEGLRQRAQLEQEAAVWTAVGKQKLESGDLTGALDQFRRATAAMDVYAPAHFQMGLVLQRLGQPDAARAAFDRARQLNPGLVPPATRQ